MNSNFPLRTALRIAWRESRASTAKFLFVILAVAVGVGSLTGVRGFSRSFRTMLLKDARTLMAADMTVRVFELPTTEQDALFAKFAARGIDRTWVTETVSMLNAPTMPAPLLVAVKAVDPAKYPFHGEIKTLGDVPLAQLLEGPSIAVSDDLLVRTGLKKGGKARLGNEEFFIRGILTYEPDRMSGSVNVGPRVMITRTNLEKAGLLQPGSRSAQRFLFKFPPEKAEAMIREARTELVKAFPDGVVADFRETHPLITRGLNNATNFLSLVSLIALVVGSLGVAMAMQSHLQQKLDSIAVMKALGSRSSQILRIYMLQAMLLAIAGAAAGLWIGYAIQKAFPVLIARFFPVAPVIDFEWSSVAEGLGLSLLATLLFVLPPLLSIRQIKPILIFRRDMEGVRTSLPARWKQWRASIAAGLLICIGVAGMASFLIDAPNVQVAARIGGWFVGGLTGALLLLTGLSWSLLRLLKRLPVRRFSSLARHGLANLYRPGNRAEAVLVAFSLGVMFTLTIYLLQHSLLSQIAASAPPGMPNVFLINITAADRETVAAFLKNRKEIEGPAEVIATAAGHLKNVDTRAVNESTMTGPARRFLRSRTITWSREMPPQSQIVQGKWWKDAVPKEPEVSVLAEAANLLNVKPGSVLTWDVSGRRIVSRVAAVHRNESVRPGTNAEFVFSPGALDNVPVLYFGAVRVRNDSIAVLQRASFEKFPAITVINLADVLDRVQEVIDQVAIVVRFISAFAILAGVIILASSIAGSRMRRVREVVILKTLGATRRKIAAIFSVEFFLLGLVAGIMGSVLAVAFTNVLLARVLDAEFRFEWAPNFIAVAGSALVAILAGWMASFKILNQRPLEILRDE
ncbi:MAG: FtsX-like permease family protein [Acidobacteria bacterium]|nr:FtsX-like permease family protein [Acidobacteriota bacterium]